MKLIIMLIAGAIIIFALLSCSRDLTNPLEADSDLNHQPKITSIQFSNNQLVLSLDWSYSNEAVLLFERKSEEAFEPIAVQKLTASTFADNTLNLEQSYNLVYRFKVKKGDYQTEYSAEKSINYNSTLIFAPTEFSATTIELQGVRLNWQDNSSVETGYQIEKSENGGAFTELVSLAANATTYLHNISGMPANAIHLSYRIKAFNNTLSSSWIESSAVYSGLGAPTNLVITDSTSYHFTIEWTRNSTLATSYEIERKKDSGNWSVIQSVGATTQTYTEQLSEMGLYEYRVRARKDNSYSSYSNIVSSSVNELYPTEGLISYYPFNGNPDDQGSYDNTSVNNGAVLTTDRFGAANCAYQFDYDDYIRCSTNGFPTGNNDRTVMGWFKVDSFGQGGTEMVFFCYGVFTGDQLIGMNTWQAESGIKPRIVTVTHKVVGNTDLSTGVWYFLGFKNGGNNVSLYINGVLNQSGSITLNTQTNGNDFYIGANNLSGIRPFWGSIDDVFVYDRALSDAEILGLYNLTANLLQGEKK